MGNNLKVQLVNWITKNTYEVDKQWLMGHSVETLIKWKQNAINYKIQKNVLA